MGVIIIITKKIIVGLCIASLISNSYSQERRIFENSVDMKMIQIPAGKFQMGAFKHSYGYDFDEFPAHKVTFRKLFYMSVSEVTNEQYEKFDPKHKKKRGIKGLSKEDDEAVVNVSWYDAMAFCKWLSKREGKPYRLPTEAEWEYACRAGTNPSYPYGMPNGQLPEGCKREQSKHFKEHWNPVPVSTKVMVSPANPWGLYDMHGNVEEWCYDWYGPYIKEPQTDPVGPVSGQCKITRGGSHNTLVRYLRSSQRLGTLPQDKSWIIGFRVVMGKFPRTKPFPPVVVPAVDETVKQTKWNWAKSAPDPKKPYFTPITTFVKIPPQSIGPLYSTHNHEPDFTYCPNGDLLAIWNSSTLGESSREHSIGMARLRAGNTEWDDAKLFWIAPGRNLTGCSVWTDKKGKIFAFNGIGTRDTWANLAVFMRTSTDSGKTWSKERMIFDHGSQNQLHRGLIKTSNGKMILLGDLGINYVERQCATGTALHISDDDGETWYNPTEHLSNTELLKVGKSSYGTAMYGYHGSIVELADGSLMGLTRGSRIDNKMAKSISKDGGKTWIYFASPLQVVGGAQRNVLIRLKEGPLFYAGFANLWIPVVKKGKILRGNGLFGAISYDEGKTWNVKKLITDGKPDHQMDGLGNTHKFTMGPSKAEPAGYLASVQTPDKVIHLISSGLHYSFNLKWLETPWK